MRLVVNGLERELEVAQDATLADVLRRNPGLTGAKIGCSDGRCGSCIVLLDGRLEHPVSTGPYGAKGIGELPSIPTAPAICNAIYGAVACKARLAIAGDKQVVRL
jgi:hypothetical protein